MKSICKNYLIVKVCMLTNIYAKPKIEGSEN